MLIDWNIPLTSSPQPLTIPLRAHTSLFIVGANGSGKSALVQHAVMSLQAAKLRRISAHRQTWLPSGSIDMTPQNRRNFGEQLQSEEREPTSPWQDWVSGERLSSVLFDLTAKENTLARRIMSSAFEKDQATVNEIVSNERPVFDQINDLLKLASLSVTIQNSDGEEILAYQKEVSESYSMAQMSDGERNAVIIAANVLTVEPGTILLIDEPERHLHRSIIVPFLSALFERRPDCAFVISTHEIALPLAHPEAPVLIIRSCQWNGDRTSAWDATLLETGLICPMISNVRS